jgi:hypothetical protein
MQWNQPIHNVIESRIKEEDFNSFLHDLLTHGLIEDDMHKGITKLVLNKGYEILTDKQKQVFMYYVLAPNYIEKCIRDAEDIPWCEMVYAVEEGDGLCSYCRHLLEKDD